MLVCASVGNSSITEPRAISIIIVATKTIHVSRRINDIDFFTVAMRSPSVTAYIMYETINVIPLELYRQCVMIMCIEHVKIKWFDIYLNLIFTRLLIALRNSNIAIRIFK